MDPATGPVVLKGAHVMDPEQGIDGVADVHLADGKIQFVGSHELTPNTKIVDVSGHYLSAGWIDIHVHAYGTLGFANPDTVGVYQGVTTFVDAGGPGIGVLDQFMELLVIWRPASMPAHSFARWVYSGSILSKATFGHLARCRLLAGSTSRNSIGICCVTSNAMR